MKKGLLIALVCALSVNQVKSQFVNWEKTGSTWLYDFSGEREAGLPYSLSGGPVIGAYTNTSTATVPGWLPAPVSGSAYIKTHAHETYNGGYDLLPEGAPNSLRVRITQGGVTKFSLIDAGDATEITRFASTIQFGSNGTAGLIRMALGGNTTTASSGVFTSGSNVASGVQAIIKLIYQFLHYSMDCI